MGTSKFKSQNQRDLKSHHRQNSTLFSDPTFPSVNAVLGTSESFEIPSDVQWKRLKELNDNPKMFVEVETWSTIRAGPLSCNWFASACSILAGLNELRNKVIPEYWDQEISEKYCGMFYFKFWRFGQWQEVVIDDCLPCDSDNVLLTTQSTSPNEYWPALLEKAYAKLHGSYENLRQGELCDALVDFTGGVSEVIDLRAEQLTDMDDKRSQFLDTLIAEHADHSIICFTAHDDGSEEGSRTELGLMKGHSYHLTDVKRVYLGETTLRNLFKGREKVSMIRLRNLREEGAETPKSPDSAVSGESSPYAFSTSSLSRLKSRLSEWQRVKDSERQRLGLLTRDSHEFWMPLEDAVAEFSEAVIIRLVTENLFALGRKWRGSSQIGRWEPGPANRSGGGTPDSESFLSNPQYVVDINCETEIIIQLLQFHSVLTTNNQISDRMHFLIGLNIIKVEENRETRVHKIWPHQETLVTHGHKRRREVTYRGRLPPGRHMILPSTYKAGDSAMFLLRLVSTSQLSLKELKDDIPKKIFLCSCVMPDIELVTVITIKNAEYLGCTENDPWQSSNVNPYCVIYCEGDKAKTGIAKNDSQPLWNKSFIFYRKKPNKPLLIQVFTHNAILRDKLLGECEVPAAINHGQSDLSVTLRPRTKDTESPSSDLPPPSAGTLHITLITEDNLQAV